MKKKSVLFIDRDGTLIIEPPIDKQVDSLEKLAFFPKVIRNLYQIANQMDYELVMVTNQDGLGTTSFPEDTFWLPHNKMLETFEQEGIQWKAIHIDRTFEHENAPTRKPGTAMLTEYINNPAYDLSRSFVIGDRLSDMQLAYNLGAKGILIQDPGQNLDINPAQIEEVIELITLDWDEIYQFLGIENSLHPNHQRAANMHRKTKETDVKIQINLDGQGQGRIHTGIGFLDHMLEQVAKHAQCELQVEVNGDLHIDEHHTIEDTAIVLGQAFREALGNKRGISRYGHFLLAMDESLAQVAIDFSGRPWLVWDGNFKREKVGGMPTEMFQHFFKSFSDQALCTLNIQVEGANEHHMIEAVFKAFARAIRMAIQRDPHSKDLPSTKGLL